MKLLSLDIPWSSRNGNVGAAMCHVENAQLVFDPLVDSIGLNQAAADNFPADDLEVAGFIADGVGPGRQRQQDVNGIAFDYVPNTALNREAYLRRLWNSFVEIRGRLQLTHERVDVVTIDIPLVPAALAQQPIPAGIRSQRRPVERAFEKKIWIPGQNPRRADGCVNLAIFMSGNLNRFRPGYAIARLAQRCFHAFSVVESFPQLGLGALAEACQLHQVPLVTNLNAHKRGAAGQLVLDQQLAIVMPGPLNWLNPVIGPRQRADGYDAVLGLLPALIYAGYMAPVAANVFNSAVLLKNLTYELPPLPARVTGQHGAHGTQLWKQVVGTGRNTDHLVEGVDDRGILAIDLNLWG